MKQRPLWQKILLAVAVFFVLSSWWGRVWDAHKKGRGALAIVHVTGPIHSSMASTGWAGPDAEDVAERLHKISEDDDIKAILLRINSPGGTVGAVQEIQREMARCRAKGKT